MRKAWETVQIVDPTQPNLPFDHRNRNIREKLIEAAIASKPPFNQLLRGKDIGALCETLCELALLLPVAIKASLP